MSIRRGCLILVLGLSSSIALAVDSPESIPANGSWWTALMNRGTLRAYADKLQEHKLTLTELADYVAKGGSVNEAKSYDLGRGSGVGSVLSLYIEAPYQPGEGRDTPPDRMTAIDLLLASGADPNFSSEDVQHGHNPHDDLPRLSPTLFAAWAGDIEAVKRLVTAGGDVNRIEDRYVGSFGPALSLAQDEEVRRFLLEHGAKPTVHDGQGRTLLHRLVDRPAIEVDDVAKEARWLLAHGVDPAVKDGAGRTAADIVRADVDILREAIDLREAELPKILKSIASDRRSELSDEQNKTENDKTIAEAKVRFASERKEDLARLALLNAALEAVSPPAYSERKK